MNPSAVEQLLELAGKATPLPWEVNTFEDDGYFGVQVRAGKQASWVDKPMRESIVFDGEGCYTDAVEEANAEFAVAAVNEIIPLAQRLQRIEEAARLVVGAAIEHENDPTAETAQTLKAFTKHLDGALVAVSGEPDE